jgi:holo-[acyl-carrier protein] synthase
VLSGERGATPGHHRQSSTLAPVTPTGIGLDLLDIDRLERALERRPRLAQRVFTDGERSYAAGRARPARHLAARFCAKEAVAKALGLAAFSFRDVEVVADEGAPVVRLTGAAAARARELGVTPRVSLTHERSVAAAAAVLWPDVAVGGASGSVPGSVERTPRG